ncbi:MAG: endolytic transglycosylase MltG [Desulfobulbaceae bacterium]|nr:endolytic transglycosylase MltG [Desulfobulbaceae bacterium]
MEQEENVRSGISGWRLCRFCFLLFFLSLLAAGGWLYLYAVTPMAPGDDVGRTVVIPPGASLSGIQRILVKEELVADDFRFRLLARLLQVGRRLQAGEYHLAKNLSPAQLLFEIESGRIVQRPVTIPEGVNLKEVAAILASGGWLGQEEFLRLVRDPDFVRRQMRVDAATLEGYLFPDTYYLTRGMQGREIVAMMVARLRTMLGELGIDREGKVGQGLTLHQVLTLASIVEKETAAPSERPLIAQVFLNRLQRGMRLQTDPTVIYGLASFDGNLTRKDLRTPTPYNTYIIKGLPPGPIGNPGRASIEAVLNPAEGSYLYFVSKNDSTHYFSKSLAEHNRAVRKYQKYPRR